MALPGGASGFTLTFGTYGEPSFIGMTVKIRLSEPMVHLATGNVTEVSWSATVGSDGTATTGPLPFNDDPAFYPTPTGYYAEWQALSYKPTPGNKTFVVLRTAGAVVDYDLIGTPGYSPIVDTIAIVGTALVGTSTVG
jgi:hypothetical protein